jgi:hypothetical protein
LSELIIAEKQNRKEFTNELNVLETSSLYESKITATSESKVERDTCWESQEAKSNNLEQTKIREYFILILVYLECNLNFIIS